MSKAVCNIAIYSIDPPALDAFHAFDPESYVVAAVIADALLHIDLEGNVQPSLAVTWRQHSPLDWDFKLRQGVRFSNGDPFDADSVVATFEAHRAPDDPTMNGRGILSPIVKVTKLDDFTVRLTTAFPDAMLLRRLFFSQIYSARTLRMFGRAYFREHPDGVGAYRLVRWDKGREIVLARNPDHWARKASIDEVHIKIARQKEWVQLLRHKDIDVAWNLDSHDAERLRKDRDIEVLSRSAALSHWFLLANRGSGPLADRRVRQALNHAVHQPLLVEVAERGRGAVQTSIATPESEGHNPHLRPYPYNPELAKQLLAEAGYADGFPLRGIVSETSTAVYLATKEFLARIGVELEAEVMPRAEWIARVVGGNMTGHPYDGDFAVSVVDNPTLDSIFHQFIFLFSQGPFSLTRCEAYDQAFLKAATELSSEDADAGRRQLEAYVRDEALVLFTAQQHVYSAVRTGFSTRLPRSGHFNADAFWSLRAAGEGATAVLPPTACDAQARSLGDMDTLVEATSYMGTFYLKPGTQFQQAQSARLWNNISVAEERWRLQIEPMMHELVTQAEVKNNLANVMRSTEKVGIVGYSRQGRRVFVNRGFHALVCGDETRTVQSILDEVTDNPRYAEITAAVDVQGSWAGAVHLPREGRPVGAASHLHLTASPSYDEMGVHVGYTFVFSDFSGEEERIRNQAIRTILDNVPYGLFMIDRDLRVMEGYSSSCDDIFCESGPAIRGKPIAHLLDLDTRTADHFTTMLGQVFDDLLPEEVGLGQLPPRLHTPRCWISINASVIRDADGSVASLLLSALDITRLIEAEYREEETRGVLQVLRHRDRFVSFVQLLDGVLEDLTRAEPTEAWQHWARRELHTAKGVFAQYSLMELARFVHAVEDEELITTDHILKVRLKLHTLIEGNRGVWHIDLRSSNREYAISDTNLEQLTQAVQAAGPNAPDVVNAWANQLRQQRFGDLLGPLDEAVVQLAARRDKHVRFELEGADLLVPPGLEPLISVVSHLTRNAVDHGVEHESERGAKPALATVRMVAERLPGAFSITVSDDGRGINVAAVLRKAVELSVLTETAAAAMPREEALRLIFSPSLSTADQVSDSSGRGVGMSAVLDAVQRLGGTIRIDSEPGTGTTVRLAVPVREGRTRAVRTSRPARYSSAPVSALTAPRRTE